MNIADIKKKMLEYRDLYGMDIYEDERIKKAKTKKELSSILDAYFNHIEDRERDARSHFDSFRNSLKLNIY